MKKISAIPSIAITFLVFVWGISWSIYKVSLLYSPPILFAGMRALLGGLLLSLFILRTRKRVNWRENWFRYCISALFNTILFFGIQTVGLIYLPGGLFSVLVYFQPVLIGLFAWIWLGEILSLKKIIGLITGFLGILAVSADGITGQISMIGVVLAILAAICWALGVIYIKKESNKVDSLWMVALQCTIGGAVLIGIGTIVEDWSSIVWNQEYLLGVVFGATFGIPISFSIYYGLINNGDASKVASFTFLVPLIAVLTGTVFLNEPITYTLIVGLILIVISIVIVNYEKKDQENKINVITYDSGK
ncbi:DMT family transporter [Bacillus sp. JJ1532]|uniref:DMT family transporter n=1 Tax=Bacillus sp. JJ1532 TaxID=3122958 RepID=UPI002FFDD886